MKLLILVHFLNDKDPFNGNRKNYNLRTNEGFVILHDVQVNYMFYWRFHFENEIPINFLSIQWK